MKIDEMKLRLTEYFPGDQIEVIDLTGNSDHWEVSVTSGKFLGLSRIEQHQKVMSAFQPELKTGEVHALSIRTFLKN